MVGSDGIEARVGSLTASCEWFKIWRAVDGGGNPARSALQLETLLRGVFDKPNLLQFIRHFVAFEDDPDSDRVHKILAGYHQFHAVNAAVEQTLRASAMGGGGRATDGEGTFWAGQMEGGKEGDRRAGVVWHTQGSGKSLSMLYFAGRMIVHPAMDNPTVVMLTDRNDLDDQLFGQFQRCHELLRQVPVQAEDREHLRKLLQVASGGVVFTTIQKFMSAGVGGTWISLWAGWKREKWSGRSGPRRAAIQSHIRRIASRSSV